jgi:hypothetical protein
MNETQQEYVNRFTVEDLIWVCCERLEGHARYLSGLADSFGMVGNEALEKELTATSRSIFYEVDLLRAARVKSYKRQLADSEEAARNMLNVGLAAVSAPVKKD